MVTYKDSGVDIDKSNEAKKRIKQLVKSTFSKNVLTGIGTFGALFSFDGRKYRDAVLVSSSDGVGTKIKLAIRSGKYDTIGQDLVNHCVNDILVMGAKPLFFLDYIALGKMDANVVEHVVKGLSIACKSNGLSLIGGETAEMPGLYKEGDFDLAGFIVGAVERKEILDGKAIKEGDVIIGLASSGLHTNGYSLANNVVFEMGNYGLNDKPQELGGKTIREALMAVHTSYLKPVSALRDVGGTGEAAGDALDLLGDQRRRTVLQLRPLRLDPLGERFGAERLHQDLDARLVLVVAPENERKASAELLKMNVPHYTIGRMIAGKKQVILK